MRDGSNRPGRERSTEFQGKTVDEAIRAASHRFRVPPEELDIEVVDEGRIGFLGLGAKEARIRARLKPQARRSDGPDDRRARRTGGGRDRRTQGAARGGDRGMVQGGTAPGGSPFIRDRDRDRDAEGRGGPERVEGGRRRRRGGRGRSRDEGRVERPERQDRGFQAEPAAPRARTESVREARPSRAPGPREGSAAIHDPALEQEINAFVTGLLERMGFPGTVSSRFEDGAYCLTVEAGDEDGILIGRKGETLDALQHVAYKMSGRGRDDASTVRIDIAGYLERREIELAREAVEMAKEVAATRRSRQTEPMRAAERRIIHRAISEIEGVTTRALGTGLVKRISIEVEGSPPPEVAERETTRPLAEAIRPAGSAASKGGVLDFVSEPAPDRADDATEQEKAVSEWGRKPKPARPGRRR